MIERVLDHALPYCANHALLDSLEVEGSHGALAVSGPFSCIDLGSALIAFMSALIAFILFLCFQNSESWHAQLGIQIELAAISSTTLQAVLQGDHLRKWSCHSLQSKLKVFHF